MADLHGHDPDELVTNVNITGINDQISQILKGCSSKPKMDIKEDLVTHVDYDALQECRTLMFKNTVGTYEHRLTEKGITGKVKLELKQRRTRDNVAADIIEMFLYIIGATEYFPRILLSSSSTYIEIIDIEGSSIGSGSKQLELALKTASEEDNSENGVPRDVCPNEQCKSCKSEITRLWQYVYNIEAVYKERFSDLQKHLGINGLNSAGVFQHAGVNAPFNVVL